MSDLNREISRNKGLFSKQFLNVLSGGIIVALDNILGYPFIAKEIILLLVLYMCIGMVKFQISKQQTGFLLLSINRTKYEMVLSVIIFVILMCFGYYSSDWFYVYFWFLLAASALFFGFSHNEIWDKGILNQEGFWKWENIYFFEWGEKECQVLTLIIKKSIPFKKYGLLIETGNTVDDYWEYFKFPFIIRIPCFKRVSLHISPDQKNKVEQLVSKWISNENGKPAE